MKATKKNNSWILDKPGAPTFLSMFGAIGWPEPGEQDDLAKCGVIVGGKAEDGFYQVIEEHLEPWGQILTTLVDLKDRLLPECLLLDGSNKELVYAIVTHDGLTTYQFNGYGDTGAPLWRNDKSVWPHFRDRDTTTSVRNVPEDIRTNFPANAGRISQLASNQNLVVRSNCPKTASAINRPTVSESGKHPLFKALCWLTWQLTLPNHTTNAPQSPGYWYGPGVWLK
jgi:hypothetical protein